MSPIFAQFFVDLNDKLMLASISQKSHKELMKNGSVRLCQCAVGDDFSDERDDDSVLTVPEGCDTLIGIIMCL